MGKHERTLGTIPISPVEHMLKTGLLGFDDRSKPAEPKLIIYGCEAGRVDHY